LLYILKGNGIILLVHRDMAVKHNSGNLPRC
jgi:hypothetical protein